MCVWGGDGMGWDGMGWRCRSEEMERKRGRKEAEGGRKEEEEGSWWLFIEFFCFVQLSFFLDTQHH